MTEPVFFRPTRPRRRLPSWLRKILIVAVLVLLLPYGLAPLYNAGRPVSTAMIWRWIAGQRVERIFTPLQRISPALPLAVIIAEDGRFCSHWGLDFQEIQNAIAQADDFGDARGGSTLTQQLVKNLFLWNGRSYVRKVLEAPLAIWLELVMSKRRIMELYLNVAEWGPDGEFGAEAGSRRAFGRPAASLGAAEAALLAAVLPNPLARDARRPGPAVRRLAALYIVRASSAQNADQCVRKGP
jgi:monofunctional biosynthetic peptidoglycan transglycosylase